MRRRSTIHGEEAQGLIEFALLSVVLLYFFLGTVDFGRFLYYASAIRSSAEVGAELASNHCAYQAYSCGTTDSGNAVTDNFVVWATYCEAAPAVNLNLGQYTLGQQSVTTPAYVANSSIGPCAPNDASASWTPTCATGATCAPCSADICVAPATRTSGVQVSVMVGYDFQPITPFIATFFSPVQCWQSTDSPAPSQSDSLSNNHTLCAKAVGQVY